MQTTTGTLINELRLNERIEQLSRIGRIAETGVCRLALTPEDMDGIIQVRLWMEKAGLTTRLDAFGNLIGRLEGADQALPILMIGSHIDSQPYGGRYDGAIGVLGALEAVQCLIENGIQPRMPIEVIAFCDEEGSRFNKGLFGSRGITGQLEEGELDRQDKNGVTRREALEAFGCSPSDFEEAIYPPGSIGSYLELHIEQGPVLEALNAPVGLVTGISGPLWLTVTMKGMAGHAGSVPMAMRHDALVGSAKVIAAFDDMVREDPEAPTVGTVGSLRVFPDSRNIIPEEVSFTVDLRDMQMERRNRLEARLMNILDDVSSRYGLTYSLTEDTNSEPRYCAESIKSVIRSSAEEIGVTLPELMSGPFHDALALSLVCDYGMIFVRSKDGISHHPSEYSSPEDIGLGTEVLYRTIRRMCSGESEPTILPEEAL
ncbi:allantoate deiminase/N-carbamoyl-L-amino-acid hydrolase [Paenibacillus sp. CF095]|uniref:M20 family metallo-hydrolase n=1 Tax=Paenibacillus sp. CF095 TaxID=1881033 RepID=UPI00088AEE6F|nr:M20 family metallo-hydrolase [Paenibacillus sp. CF095]SDD37908.1 allantoate deiminase/N-carbamoyl-L-amino-acid hydrolase [Paenibacillus sp. CF095]